MVGGRRCKRKLLFVDAKKAHLNPRCLEDVYIELPKECGVGKEFCGKLNFWLYGFRKAASAWEDLCAKKFEECGFLRWGSCGVVFYHPQRDLACVVHGDDFTFCGYEDDFHWARQGMASWFEIKVRAILGEEDKDDKEVVILGRTVRWQDDGIYYEADEKHRILILESLGMVEGQMKSLAADGEKDFKEKEHWELEEVCEKEAT